MCSLEPRQNYFKFEFWCSVKFVDFEYVVQNTIEPRWAVCVYTLVESAIAVEKPQYSTSDH